MDEYEAFILSVLPTGWEYERGFGSCGTLTCPHGHEIEQDGECPEGCVSPLREMGMV